MFQIQPDDSATKPPDSTADAKALSKAIASLAASFAATNRILTASFGDRVADRRSDQTYYIDVGALIGTAPDGANPISITPEIAVNTSNIAQLVSPSLGKVDLKFEIGVDSYSIHRRGTPTRPWPITVVCPTLQAANGSRYLTLLSGENGNALSPTAKTVFYGEIPSLLNFSLGFQSPIPTDASGGLTSNLFPLVYNNAYEAIAPIPSIPGEPAEKLWSSSEIYAVTLRLFVIPLITPRVRYDSAGAAALAGQSGP